MENWKLGAITITIAALVGAFAVVAYGYGMGGIEMMNGQYSPYSDSQGQKPWGYQGMMGNGRGMMGPGMMGRMGNGMMSNNWQDIGGNNWQGMMGACHSYMNQHWYCYRYFNNITSQPDQVLIMHYSFVPNVITISKGATVTWINMDPVIHTVESGTHEQPIGLFDSGPLYQGQSFSYTFTEPGVYVYHCDPHPYMWGMVIVQG